MSHREVMQQALVALENSVDLVRHEYNTDWRHGLPTRKAQLDGMKEGLDAHEATITALRTALEQQADPERWCMKANGCKTKCGNCPNFPSAQQQAEPVAWAIQACSKMWRGEFAEIDAKAEAKRIGGTCVAYALYTSPPQRQWVGLTDEDFLEACQIAERGNYLLAFQRIQIKLKERNHDR